MKNDAKNAIERGRTAADVRGVLVEHGFKEVMTPILRTGNCKINRRYQTDDGRFLRDCYELPIIQLLSSEAPRLFELGPCFRPNDGNDATHLQEFYLVEFYAIGQSLELMKTITEDIVRKTIPWKVESKVISIRDFIKEDLGFDIAEESTEKLIGDLVKKYHYCDTDRAHEIVGTYIEQAIEPLTVGLDKMYFLTDYPMCTLAVSARVNNLNYLQRFECYIDRLEIGHAFVGSDDADDMWSRLIYADVMGPEESRQVEMVRQNLIHSNVGHGIGIDRLCMVKSRVGA